MAPPPLRKHAGPAPASDAPPVAEPTFAERVRTLVYLGRLGSLSTLSRKQPGFPFGSVMPYGLDEHGRPIFLISTMAMHTQNLKADPRSSLLVTQDEADGDPLGASRVTLVGNVLPVPEAEIPGARKVYLERQPNSKYWVDFEDFSFYRMDVVDTYYVGGFGVMSWVAGSENCRLRGAGGDDDGSGSPRLQPADEDSGRHEGRPHRVSPGSTQFWRGSERVGRNGSTAAFRRMTHSYLRCRNKARTRRDAAAGGWRPLP